MGLSVAASALEADQLEMSTVAGNLANATTPGYAVEQVDQVDVAPTGGVAVVGIDQLGSSLLDSALRTAQAAQSSTEVTQQALSSVEGLFPEPSGNGLSSQLSQLWSDLSSVAASPGNTAAQGVVIQDAATVASTLNSTYDGLAQTSSGLVTQVGSGTGSGELAQANTYLADVASLNGRIVAGTAAGSDVNALVDTRREDLSKLSQLIGATARAEPGGAVTVFALGVALVQGTNSGMLLATGSPPDPPPAPGAPPGSQLGVSTSSGVVVPVGGSIGAALTAVNSTLPGMQSELSAVANALAGSLNALQAAGMDAAGVPGSSLPAIFVNAGSTAFVASTSSAGSIAVDPALTAGQIATASASAG
ncbi:MAG: flagellar basal body protein, partial [Actinomycetota bacterium]|nr:flagellar basal body protein [Actinomycetota bacterium]